MSASKLLFLVPFLMSTTAFAQPCTIKSPPHRVALVELYTSEGCNSCPPADHWLADFVHNTPRDKAVGVSLHVPYWDYIGWKDRFASETFSERQRLLASVNNTTVYTPQFFIAGSTVELNAKAFAAAIEAQNILPTAVDITATYDKNGATKISWHHDQEEGKVFLIAAVTAASAQSQVTAGENKDVLLKHAEVVRWWHPLNNTGKEGTVSITIPKLSGEIGDAQGHALVLATNRQGKVYQVLSWRKDCSVDK